MTHEMDRKREEEPAPAVHFITAVDQHERRKQLMKMKRVFGVLLTLALALLAGVLPGMRSTALADTAYSAYLVTTDANKEKSVDELTALRVTFNGKPWYIIEDNSASNPATVTLLAADTSFGLSAFDDSYPYINDYDSSTVKSYLDRIVAGTAGEGKPNFKNVASAIADAGNGKLYLLSTEEAGELPENVLKMKFTGEDCRYGQWWLRSPGIYGNDAAIVKGDDGQKIDNGDDVEKALGVRPALKLKLSFVLFSSVTLSGGANATASGGGIHQNYFDDGSSRSAMTTVTYTAKSGYKFPATSEYYTTTNGIIVARTSDTAVTVSGTPDGVANITVPDAVHTHSFTYSADGAAITATCASGCPDGYDTNGVAITLTAPGNLTYNGSEKEAAVSGYPTAAPGGLAAKPTITYYKAAGSDPSTPEGDALSGAPSEPGNYVAQTAWGGKTASLAFAIQKEIKVTFKVVNGYWNEGDQNNADIEVTLSGPSAALNLPADKIPAVSEKPIEHYQAGGWDVTPDTATAITQDTTFTYTYAIESYPLWIGGTQANYNNRDSLTDNHWSYNLATHTLTLSGYTYQGQGYVYNASGTGAAIYYNGAEALTVVLSGENHITPAGTKSGDCGIVNDGGGTLSFSGGGSLRIDSVGNFKYYNSAIYSRGTVIFKSGSFKLGNNDADYGVRVNSGSYVVIENGVTAFEAAGYMAAVNGPVRNAVPGTGYDAYKERAGRLQASSTGAALTYTSGLQTKNYQIATFPMGEYQVVFNHGDGSGNMDPTEINEGEKLKLPACTFTPPKDDNGNEMAFNWWEVSGADGIYYVDSEVLIANNCAWDGVVTVTAKWKAKTDSSILVDAEGQELDYTGAAQALLSQNGVAFGGTMMYAIGTDGITAPTSGWDAALPQKTDAGTYYIWFKVAGNEEHFDSEAKCTTAKINQAAAQTIADVTDSQIYTLTSVSASVAGKMPDGAGTLTYTAGTASTTGSVTVSDFAVDASGNVTATLSGGAAGDTVTLPVTISSTNYADSTVQVVITLTAKDDAGVTVSGVPTQAKTYGDADFTLTGSVTDAGTGTGVWTWTSSDDAVFQITPNGATAAVKILKAGSATVTAKYESDTTVDTETTAAITVNTKTLTIAAKDQTIYVGSAVPTLSGADFYTVSGLVGEETLTANPTLAYQKNGEAATPDNTTAGTYDIVPSGASAGDNYSVSYTNGTLTITDKNIQTVTASDVTATYGDTNKSVSGTTDGDGAISYAVKDGSGDYIDVDGSTGALTIKKVPADGKACVTVTAAETQTYAQATQEVTVNISKAEVTVTAKAQTVKEGESIDTAVNQAELSGAMAGHALSAVTLTADAKTITPSAAEIKNGEGNDVTGNYTVTYSTGSLTILSNIEQKIETKALTAVPPELENQYPTLEALKQGMLLRLVVGGQPARAENTAFFDVQLMMSLDGGKTWVPATEENCPAEGLPVTLPYPAGTSAQTHHFAVAHMFTLTSARMGTVAGAIEYPAVTAAADGLHVVLHGLSPVAVAYEAHTPGEAVREVIKPATCQEDGTSEEWIYCADCGQLLSHEIIQVQGAHEAEEIPAVPPTCTKKGSTAGEKCRFCGVMLTKPEPVPALGHDYREKRTIVEIGQEGVMGFICARCGDTITSYFLMGDVNGDGVVDGRDLLRLARFLAGQDVEIIWQAAEITGDGEVDGRDLLRLAKYVAGVI